MSQMKPVPELGRALCYTKPIVQAVGHLGWEEGWRHKLEAIRVWNSRNKELSEKNSTEPHAVRLRENTHICNKTVHVCMSTKTRRSRGALHCKKSLCCGFSTGYHRSPPGILWCPSGAGRGHGPPLGALRASEAPAAGQDRLTGPVRIITAWAGPQGLGRQGLRGCRGAERLLKVRTCRMEPKCPRSSGKSIWASSHPTLLIQRSPLYIHNWSL